ncbi:ArsR/SmtB family transcription factor, partial [Leucobacter sp. M11]|uniref:ArsR/SmtB family transcription factor n=1 Tax=Leucobacter sp. M11 TaxID=2993565 RepID=UPI002D7FA839
GPVQWQYGVPTEQLLESDWSEHAQALAALASPVRLTILHAFLAGATSAAELSAAEGLGTTGQLYHHLNQLVAQGWLRVAGRGQYAVPPERIVPLLAILAAVGSPA